MPQETIPSEIRQDSELLARFFFLACIYMRGGITSATAFKGLFLVYQDDPGMFNANVAMNYSLETIKTKLSSRMGNWDIEVAAYNWKENCRRLATTWNGSVLNIFKDITNYEEALERIRNKKGKHKNGLDAGFVGFQHKMTSMLCYFLVDAGLVPGFEFPPPVDFHHLRILFGHEILTIKTERAIRYGERILEPARSLLSRYLKTRHSDTPGANLELADALWLFSLTICSNAPGNTTAGNGGGRKELKERKKKDGDWVQIPLKITGEFSQEEWRHNQTRKYLNTCGRCPMRTTCRHFAPAEAYYRRGILDLKPHLPMRLPIPSATKQNQSKIDLFPEQISLPKT